MLVLFEAREDGCFREVAAVYGDHYGQVPLQSSLIPYVWLLQAALEEKHEQERRVTENTKTKMQEQLLVKVCGGK